VASSAAHYSGGSLRILVVDRNPLSILGRKTMNGWVCGDAVGKKSVDYMSERIGITWSYPEIEHPVKGVIAYSPDHQTSVSFDGEGYMLNRKLLPQKQFKDATERGVLVDDCIAIRGLISENGTVIGIEGEDLTNKSVFKKTARLVIDCTGVTSVLRTNLKIKSHIERRIDRDDLEATGRYIYDFDIASNDESFFHPEYCLIHLDQKLAPGGYGWVFPKGQTKVNIGVGVQSKALDTRNKALGVRDDLKILIDQYVHNNPAISNARLAVGEMDDGNGWGTWSVSVRRQNDCMVANGYMIVGDAAWLPKPLDAGGIGPAIIAATIAGKDAVEALEANDTTEQGMWKFNKDYINDYGYKTAGLEVFRRMLQGLTNEQIDYGMKHFLSKMDVDKITNGEHPEFSTVSKVGMLIRGALNKKLAENLKCTALANEKLVEHYRNYPVDPQHFLEWQKVLHKILNDSFMKFRS
jgi:flavin-dependent dehydrogenase